MSAHRASALVGAPADTFTPATTTYSPLPPPGEPLDALFERGATRAGLNEMKAAFPEAAAFSLLRFLKARDGDVAAAAQMFQKALSWITARPPPTPELLRSRVSYAAKGRDTDGNGLVVYRGDRHDASADPERIVDAVVNACRQAADNSTSPDRKITLIVFTTAGTPTNRANTKLICSSLANNFPETCAKVLVFPTNWGSRSLWRVIRLFMDPVVAGKVQLLSGGRQPPDLPKHIAPDNIPREFGGQDPTDYDPMPRP